MLRYSAALTIGVFIGLTAFAQNTYAADKIPEYVASAVADSNRPATDTANDLNRRPAEAVAATGLKPGETVIDLFPGGGYFTRIFSKVVGPKGHVYSVWYSGVREQALNATKALIADPAYSNVSLVEQPLMPATAADAPQMVDWSWKGAPVDMVFTSRNYHDFHNMKNTDIALLNKSIFGALKPGGTYVIIDHAAATGTGTQDTGTLHRIDAEAVKQEVTAAGFVLARESDVLRRPEDPHTAKVFDPSVQGKTDQFMLVFKKPK
jgi:predicted methyltransferase